MSGQGGGPYLAGAAVTDQDKLEGRDLSHLGIVCGREGRG